MKSWKKCKLGYCSYTCIYLFHFYFTSVYLAVLALNVPWKQCQKFRLIQIYKTKSKLTISNTRSRNTESLAVWWMGGGEKKKKKRPMRDFVIIIIYYSMVKNGNVDKGGLIGPICGTKFPVHFEWDFPFLPSARIPSFSITLKKHIL